MCRCTNIATTFKPVYVPLNSNVYVKSPHTWSIEILDVGNLYLCAPMHNTMKNKFNLDDKNHDFFFQRCRRAKGPPGLAYLRIIFSFELVKNPFVLINFVLHWMYVFFFLSIQWLILCSTYLPMS